VQFGLVIVAPSAELRGSIIWRPALCTMDDARYFYGLFYHAVNDDEGKRWHKHFPRTFNASPPAAIGEGINASTFS
jgi:hypothetical protein